MGIKNQSDIILIKSCTLAINNCRVVCEAVCITTRGVVWKSRLRSASQNGARKISRSQASFVFLPSDPDALVDQLKLLCFEKVVGNDSFLLNEQMIAIVDKLLEYECITPSQHQNIRSTFDVKAP